MSSSGVQCPNCRAVSYPGYMGFPRCHRCHEQLRQCRYCVHQSGGLCRLEVSPRPRLQAEGGKPYCAGFESRLLTGEAGRLGRPFPANAVTIGLLAAIVLSVVLGLMALTHDEQTPFHIEAEEPWTYVQDGRAVVPFAVLGDHRIATEVRVRVEAVGLRHYSVESPDPVATSPAGVEFAVALPPGGRGRCTLVLLQHHTAPAQEVLRVALLGPTGEVEATADTTLLAAKRR